MKIRETADLDIRFNQLVKDNTAPCKGNNKSTYENLSYFNKRKVEYYRNRLMRYYARIIFPDSINVKYDDLIGMENEKHELQDVIEFFYHFYKEMDVKPHTRFLLGGPQGSGKSTLIYALARECVVPVIKLTVSGIIAYPKEVKKFIDLVFEIANFFSNGCIIVFDEFPMISSLEGHSLMLFHNHLLSQIRKSTNTVIFLVSSGQPIPLIEAYLTEDLFSKAIAIQAPTLSSRKEFFELFCDRYNLKLAKDVSFNRLACNTLGMYPEEILTIVRETMLYARRNGIKEISAKHFNEIMLLLEAGQKNNTLSEKERISTAYHEAGHVVAAYFSNPNYVLGRVEITPRATSLGLTKEETDEETYCLFKHDLHKKIIYAFGGMAAEHVIYGETSSGTASDLATASSIALEMFQSFGMDENIGPIFFDEDDGFGSPMLINELEKAVQEYLKKTFVETVNIIIEHEVQLRALTQALLKNEVLLGNEIKTILDAKEEN